MVSRWDTPQHVLTDDPESGDPADNIWQGAPIYVLSWSAYLRYAYLRIGKDYSNPRVMDFHALNKPFEEMYDRTKVPRMPWHDVSMQMVGQPARDLARHFVQRSVWTAIKHRNSLIPRPGGITCCVSR